MVRSYSVPILKVNTIYFMAPDRTLSFSRKVLLFFLYLHENIQLTQVILKSKGLSEILQDICTSTLISGPSCSKLTTSLVNDSLKFTSSDTQIC